MSNGLTKAIAYNMVCGFAKDELYSGVTTIRTVGGLGDFDTRLRDDIAAGKKPGSRILAANEGISVPGGHMAGIGDITGTLESGKCADMIVVEKNPLEDLRALRNVDMVVTQGKVLRSPKVKKKQIVETELDKFL